MALMRYLREAVYLKTCGGVAGCIPTVEQFTEFFAHVELEDQDFTQRHFVPGSGGQAMFYKVLAGKISADELFEKEEST